MNTKRIIQLVLLVSSFILPGCYPDGPEYIDEFDLVVTNYDKLTTFAGKGNYMLPDKIVKITGDIVQGNQPDFVLEPYATSFLNQIKTNMSALGYTLVTDTNVADYILFPSEMEVTYTSYYYDYYYYYWGWYYPYYGYGWYYPYYTTEYTTGTLMMNLVAIHETTATGKLHGVWTGLINGVLDYYGSDLTTRVNRSIDQAFDQSPYLAQ